MLRCCILIIYFEIACVIKYLTNIYTEKKFSFKCKMILATVDKKINEIFPSNRHAIVDKYQLCQEATTVEFAFSFLTVV